MPRADGEDPAPLARPEGMSSALHHYAAAQRYADPLREARRNPPLPQPDKPAPRTHPALRFRALARLAARASA